MGSDSPFNIMKARFSLIILVLSVMSFLIGCHPKAGFRPLFKDAAMQDSLQVFLDRIDSIPNSFDAPSLFSVSFMISGQDSLIRFGANACLWLRGREVDTTAFASDVEFDFDNIEDWTERTPIEPSPFLDDIEPHWLGLYMYGDKHVLIEADWDLSNLIDTSVLLPYEDFVKLYRLDDPLDAGCDLTFYWYNCEKTYQFHNPATFIPKHRRIGKADPDYTDHPQHIYY